MIVDTTGGVTILRSEGDNRITDENMSFFTEIICLGRADHPSKYMEVGKEIWENPLDKVKPIEIRNIETLLAKYKEDAIVLEDCFLETDYRLLMIELEKEYGKLFLLEGR